MFQNEFQSIHSHRFIASIKIKTEAKIHFNSRLNTIGVADLWTAFINLNVYLFRFYLNWCVCVCACMSGSFIFIYLLACKLSCAFTPHDIKINNHLKCYDCTSTHTHSHSNLNFHNTARSTDIEIVIFWIAMERKKKILCELCAHA